jgi:hypothetical protein
MKHLITFICLSFSISVFAQQAAANKYAAGAKEVSLCFAFYDVAKQPGLESLDKFGKLYVSDNKGVYNEKVQPAIEKFMRCTGPNLTNDLIDKCTLKLPTEGAIFDELMYGRFVRVKGSDAEKTKLKMACLPIDSGTRVK